jgi:di/tricarboxylate transporter
MSATSIIILISILVAIAIGYKTKINFGFLGIAFAFLFGCLIADLSPSKVMGLWRSKLFFQMFTVTFFYAFAIRNGALELLARKLVYTVKNRTFLIPVILWLVGFVLAGIGPGSIAMFLVLSPLFMQVAKETEMNPALAAVVMVTGVNTGAWSPIAVNGIATKGLIETAGYSADLAYAYSLVVWRNMIIASIIIFVLCYFIFKGYKCKMLSAEKPAAFNKKQSTSLTLIFTMTGLLIIPAILKWAIGGSAISWLAGKMEVTLLAIFFGVLSILLKVGSEKEAVADVPWKTIIMVCGMGLLVGTAAEAGALSYLSDYIGQSFNAAVIPYVMCIVAGIMSIFSSTMGVVIPTLYPLVYAISVASGSTPALLFSVIPIAAGYTGMSPFSLAGGLAMASAEEGKKEKLFVLLIIVALASIFVTAALVGLGLLRN